jgi:hypothetical protein
MQIKNLVIILLAMISLYSSVYAQCLENTEQEINHGEIDIFRDLKALSLDIRGMPPSVDELLSFQSQVDQRNQALAQAGNEATSYDDYQDIIESFVEDWLHSPEFAKQVTRLYRSVVWNNISNLNLYNNRVMLGATNSIYWRNDAATMYRGARVRCADEPARFDDNGNILTTMVDGNQLEGWVQITPYWAPNTSIKVCAFDAQEALFTDDGKDCSTMAGQGTVQCGCGPNLRFCATNDVKNRVLMDFATSLDKAIEKVFAQEDHHFLKLFDHQTIFLNGPLSFFFRYQSALSRYTLSPSIVSMNSLDPAVDYTAVDQWYEIGLPAVYAGILTHPTFLLRFQTNRARGSRFYDAFLCSPFQPPEGGLPVSSEANLRNPDLQLRDGCKYCHALLEPTAAYWGRWTEQGSAYLPQQSYPKNRTDCDRCAQTGQGCTAECRSFYLTQPSNDMERQYLGVFKAYTFRKSEHEINVEQGPKLLAFQAIADQRLPACTAKRAVEWLIGAKLTHHEDMDWINELGIDFARNGFDYARLVKNIVLNHRYRRVQ